MTSPTASVQPPARLGLIVRLVLLVLAIATGTVLFLRYRQQFDIHELAAREVQLRKDVETQPAAALAIAFVAYVAVTGLSLPGAAAMSVCCGWLFGFWRALVLVSFASTTGATLAFLLSRYLLGDWIQSRYAGRLQAINAAIDREGAFYLFTLRLIPQVPFFVVNAAMGLTRIRVWTFWWVSQLGMLPGTIVFVFAGASVPSLKTVAERGLGSVVDWRLFAALALLSLSPLVIKRIIGWAHRRRQM